MRTLFVIGMLFIATAAGAQSTQLATSAVPSPHEFRLAPITLRTQTDRMVQLHLTFGAQTVARMTPLPVGDVRGQTFVSVRLHVETTVRP